MQFSMLVKPEQLRRKTLHQPFIRPPLHRGEAAGNADHQKGSPVFCNLFEVYFAGLG